MKAVKKSQENRARLNHEKAISLLKEAPGRLMIANICKSTKPWMLGMDNKAEEPVAAIWYSVLGEFYIGNYCETGEGGRIDAAVIIKPLFLEENAKEYCKICMEIKCSLKDLNKDNKLDGKYLASGMFDYHMLIAADDNIAYAAVQKYKDNPAIGVASLASGRIYKTPSRQLVRNPQKITFRHEVLVRSGLKTSQDDVRYKEYYKKDNEHVMLVLNHPEICTPVMVPTNCNSMK